MINDVSKDLVVISVSENTSEALQILSLSRQLLFLKPSGGIHPEYISNSGLVDNDLLEFDQFVKTYNEELICLGECGLDYSLNVIPKTLPDREKDSKKELQKMVLRKHIEYGREYDLPLVMIKAKN
jgi:Tat protein secretion system quality control protein TatD with DNase activity